MESTPRRGILVSDFDGTLCRHDFFRLAMECLVPPDMPDYWSDYRAGRLTHFEAMQVIFRSIRKDEAAVLAVISRMELEPELARWVEALRRAGWEIHVASAGCDWYIRRLFADAGVTLPIHANPGHFEPGRGLRMEFPKDSPFQSTRFGIDKAALVSERLRSGLSVAFAGDGFPDIYAARLVAPELRFARADLAETLTQEGLPFRRFERWREVAQALLA